VTRVASSYPETAARRAPRSRVCTLVAEVRCPPRDEPPPPSIGSSRRVNVRWPSARLAPREPAVHMCAPSRAGGAARRAACGPSLRAGGSRLSVRGRRSTRARQSGMVRENGALHATLCSPDARTGVPASR
jgi:hypothetical protein